MAPFRSSRSNRQLQHDSSSAPNRSRGGIPSIDHDPTEGLPVRKWQLADVVIKQDVKDEDEIDAKGKVNEDIFWPELPLPKDFHKLAPHCQELVRRARMQDLNPIMPKWDRKTETWVYPVTTSASTNPTTPAQNTTLPNVPVSPAGTTTENPNKARWEAEQRSFTVRRWVPVSAAVADKRPEPKFLADRRPGMKSLYGYAAADNMGLSGNSSMTAAAGGGTRISYETGIGGGAMEGVVMGAGGTVMDAFNMTAGLGEAAGGMSAGFEPVRRRPPPPPPKRKKKGGVGRRKKVQVVEQAGVPVAIVQGQGLANVQAEETTTNLVPGAAGTSSATLGAGPVTSVTGGTMHEDTYPIQKAAPLEEGGEEGEVEMEMEMEMEVEGEEADDAGSSNDEDDDEGSEEGEIDEHKVKSTSTAIMDPDLNLAIGGSVTPAADAAAVPRFPDGEVDLLGSLDRAVEGMEGGGEVEMGQKGE